jgi:beta-barrel assembly-enhancing protease
MKNLKIALVLILLLPFLGCKKMKNGWNKMNVFPVSDDIALGKQVAAEIASKPQEFPLLAEAGNEVIYKYIRGMTEKILNSGKVEHRREFAWQVKIIKDDKTLNAFCTPGGYIYVYSGLIKYLDSEDQLAGVMGHEIAHAANRHSTRQMTKMLGLQVIADALTGNRKAFGQVFSAIIGLKFSRSHEEEADKFSVNYLCGTGLNAAGAAGFFQKIASKGGQPPQFLSTHPNPRNRIQNITSRAKSMGCKGTATNSGEYAKMKALLK